jgi:hypothetical protein
MRVTLTPKRAKNWANSTATAPRPDADTVIYEDIFFANTPGLLVNGHTVQWVDTGPPRTDTPPGGQGARFYRVILVQQ